MIRSFGGDDPQFLIELISLLLEFICDTGLMLSNVREILEYIEEYFKAHLASCS